MAESIHDFFQKHYGNIMSSTIYAPSVEQINPVKSSQAGTDNLSYEAAVEYLDTYQPMDVLDEGPKLNLESLVVLPSQAEFDVAANQDNFGAFHHENSVDRDLRYIVERFSWPKDDPEVSEFKLIGGLTTSFLPNTPISKHDSLKSINQTDIDEGIERIYQIIEQMLGFNPDSKSEKRLRVVFMLPESMSESVIPQFIYRARCEDFSRAFPLLTELIPEIEFYNVLINLGAEDGFTMEKLYQNIEPLMISAQPVLTEEMYHDIVDPYRQ